MRIRAVCGLYHATLRERLRHRAFPSAKRRRPGQDCLCGAVGRLLGPSPSGAGLLPTSKRRAADLGAAKKAAATRIVVAGRLVVEVDICLADQTRGRPPLDLWTAMVNGPQNAKRKQRDAGPGGRPVSGVSRIVSEARSPTEGNHRRSGQRDGDGLAGAKRPRSRGEKRGKNPAGLRGRRCGRTCSSRQVCQGSHPFLPSGPWLDQRHASRGNVSAHTHSSCARHSLGRIGSVSRAHDRHCRSARASPLA